MRHGASLLVGMEGMSRLAFRIALELTQNSRAGLTPRFLSKKLELPLEEVEYVVDVNDRLFFTDLTKVKLVTEGGSVIRRIANGLENLGDVPSLFRGVKALDSHEFRRFEERIGVERPSGKKSAVEELLDRYYRNTESLVEYVATKSFSRTAQELFDIVWQSKTGVLPVSQLRVLHGASEYEIEQALMELFQGFALFEMFRFDPEDRLVRMAGILSELRQWREAVAARGRKKPQLKTCRRPLDFPDSRGLDLSDRVSRLVAMVAAKPARVRGDGDLFREDRRRLEEICGEDDEPSLNTCLWVAQGVGWVARVDNELRAADTEDLIGLKRMERHRALFDWLVANGNELASKRLLSSLLDETKVGTWYYAMDFIEYALRQNEDNEVPVLKCAGGHWHYVSPSMAPNSDRGLARSLEEMFHWLGVVDRAECDGESVFRVTELGRALLLGEQPKDAEGLLREWKTELVVQPNFDIVVAALDSDPLMTVPLDQFADRVSTGHATVYRLSKESYTKAVQQGHDGGAFVEFLMRCNRGGDLPANVTRTLDDWRGGMKRVRLRTVQIIEAEDPLVMADLVHRRRFAKFLKPMDPARTVAISRISKSELAKELEKEGFVVD